MATLQIVLKDGKFVSHNEVKVKKFTETHIEGNSWVGDIDEKGDITFWAIRNYSGVRHSLKFEIKKGHVAKTLKIGTNKTMLLKYYKISWPSDGVFGLSNGFIDERVVYFREEFFQKILDEHNLTAVRHETANATYKLVFVHDGNDYISKEAIETDGVSNIICNDIEYNAENKPYAIAQVVEITNASWVIKSVWRFGQLRHRILYTLDDVQQILNLPKA